MRIICTECGEVHRQNRSKHLRDAHGFKTRGPNAKRVRDYFLHPEELGLARDALEEYEDGMKVCHWIDFPLTDLDKKLIEVGKFRR